MFIKVQGFWLNIGHFVAIQDHDSDATILLSRPIPGVGDTVTVAGKDYIDLREILRTHSVRAVAA